MKVPPEIAARRGKVLEAWRGLIFATYPGPSAKTFRNGRDRFRNPVGDAIRRGTEAVLDGLLAGRSPADLGPDLDGIVRLRAVQDFSPSEAVRFAFDLKEAVRSALGKDGAEGAIAWADMRADQLALVAFDLYTACRDRIREIRLSEAKARIYKRLERADAAGRPGIG